MHGEHPIALSHLRVCNPWEAATWTPKQRMFLRFISVDPETGALPSWDVVPAELGTYFVTILGEMRQLEQFGEWHNETVLHHTRGVCEHLGPRASAEEVASAFLHDSAKPECATVDEFKVRHFPEHASRGMARAIILLFRLGFPRVFVERVANTVANHMLPHWAQKTGDAKWLIPLLHLTPEAFDSFLNLHRADLEGRAVQLLGVQGRMEELIAAYRDRRVYPYVPTPIAVYDRYAVHITKSAYGQMLDAIASGVIVSEETFHRWGDALFGNPPSSGEEAA